MTNTFRRLLITFVLLILGIQTGLYAGRIKSWLGDLTFPFRFDINRQSGLMVKMRDGVHLLSDVYKPNKKQQKYPVILIRTTYGGATLRWPKFFVENDFVVVVQNVRGRFGSEGTYKTHGHSRNDGYDTVSWIVQQKWSNGKVGTFGCSYLGEVQSILATEKHPNHIAMITNGGGGAIGSAQGSYGYFGIFENGVLNLASALGWFTMHGALNQAEATIPADYKERLGTVITQLPIKDLASKIVSYSTEFEDVAEHSLTDEWWNDQGYVMKEDTFTTAGLHVNTWFDQTVHDTFRIANFMKQNAANQRAKNQHILIGPGEHCSSGKLNSGNQKLGDLEFDYHDIDYESIYLDWFNYWLRNKSVELPPKYKYYLIGNSSWQTAKQWPPGKTKTFKLFLSSARTPDSRGLLQKDPPFEQNPSHYIYDPSNPVPTLGGSICCTGREGDISGPADQRPLESRSDILIYETKILKKDIDLTGSVKVVLYVSTSATDTDFTAKLIDRFPDGKSLSLQDGVVRLRYRNGVEKPELVKPHNVYEVEIALRPIAYRFRAGHQVAIHISSSNFPRLARNLNTGASEYQGDRMEKAKNQVFHDTSHPSHVELPIIP